MTKQNHMDWSDNIVVKPTKSRHTREKKKHGSSWNLLHTKPQLIGRYWFKHNLLSWQFAIRSSCIIMDMHRQTCTCTSFNMILKLQAMFALHQLLVLAIGSSHTAWLAGLRWSTADDKTSILQNIGGMTSTRIGQSKIAGCIIHHGSNLIHQSCPLFGVKKASIGLVHAPILFVSSYYHTEWDPTVPCHPQENPDIQDDVGPIPTLTN